MADTERTAHLRENKRRFRLRRKEYVADLEKELRELKEAGIQATKEVQISARRVAKENLRLRQLLNRCGVEEGVVESWVREDNDGAPRGCTNKTVTQPMSKCSNVPISKGSAPSSAGCGRTTELVSPAVTSDSGQSIDQGTNLENGIKNCGLEPTSSHVEAEHPKDKMPSSESKSPRDVRLHMEELPSTPICKLMTHLKSNPGIDITQMSEALNDSTKCSWKEAEERGGMECGEAYKLLIQFASSEKNMDIIAEGLERGCVKGKDGGCMVKNKILWDVIDVVNE